MYVTKPYKFIRFGAMDVTKPYKFIGFETNGCHQTLSNLKGLGPVDVTKPYTLYTVWGKWVSPNRIDL